MSFRLLVVAAALCSSSCLWWFAPYSAENLCDTYVRAECSFAYRCCNAHERADNLVSNQFGRYRNEDDCVRENLVEICGVFSVLIESQNAQRFELDEERLRECYEPRITALNECDAEAVFDPPEADEDCAAGFIVGEGLVADGDLCFETFECATEDAVCKPEEPGQDEVIVSAKGTCEPPPGPGDPCPENFCADGLYCGPNAQGDNVCQNKKDTGATCQSAFECKSELCEFGDGFELVCATPRPNGESCFTNAQCASEQCTAGECGGVAQGNGVDVVVDACDGLGEDEAP